MKKCVILGQFKMIFANKEIYWWFWSSHWGLLKIRNVKNMRKHFLVSKAAFLAGRMYCTELHHLLHGPLVGFRVSFYFLLTFHTI